MAVINAFGQDCELDQYSLIDQCCEYYVFIVLIDVIKVLRRLTTWHFWQTRYHGTVSKDIINTVDQDSGYPKHYFTRYYKL